MRIGGTESVTFDNEGALTTLRISKRTVVLAAYTTGGLAQDLSAQFSSVLSVLIARIYVTATKAATGRVVEIVETGTDTYANRKFRLKVSNPTKSATSSAVSAGTPSGTNSAPTFTGTPTTPTFTGSALGTHQHSVTPNTRGTVCVATCNCTTSTAANTAANSSLVSAGTPAGTISQITPAGTNSAPTFTGDALGTHSHTVSGGVAEEISNGTDLSTLSVELIVFGVAA